MKNYNNIASMDFVNVNIALNSHAYEKSFLLEFIKKMYLLLFFKSKSEALIYDHIFKFFFYLSFLSQPFTNHRTAGKE